MTPSSLKTTAGEDESHRRDFKDKSNLVMFLQVSVMRMWRMDARGARWADVKLVRSMMRGLGEGMVGTEPDASCRAGGRGPSFEYQEGTMEILEPHG